ncbi:MAG TPA: gamma-glutamylcyclotransferase family protein [Steroidobacteraceae bacterium]|jgi:hypothetical protein|nr:gamma-glutamylcyclotransferase family protein [Steroidobacteraceae bacterium]
MATDRTASWLFSYGSLRQPKVQLAVFGRQVEGHPDTLPGYAASPITISDPQVIAISGASQHRIVRFTGQAGDAVTGTVLRVTADELRKADAYEVSEYRRVAVELSSGRRAYVYVASTGLAGTAA